MIYINRTISEYPKSWVVKCFWPASPESHIRFRSLPVSARRFHIARQRHPCPEQKTGGSGSVGAKSQFVPFNSF